MKIQITHFEDRRMIPYLSTLQYDGKIVEISAPTRCGLSTLFEKPGYEKGCDYRVVRKVSPEFDFELWMWENVHSHRYGNRTQYVWKPDNSQLNELCAIAAKARTI